MTKNIEASTWSGTLPLRLAEVLSTEAFVAWRQTDMVKGYCYRSLPSKVRLVQVLIARSLQRYLEELSC